jgi:NADPH:quinone reductase
LVRAVTLDSFDSPPRLRDDMPEPSPSDNDVVVRVLASSANPADAAVAGGAVKEMIQHDFPVTLGRDFAGVVEGTGEQVYGFVPLSNPTVHSGSWAELITVPEDKWFAAKPRKLDAAAAGVTPLAALTALGAFDALAPAGNETVLVIGATGGVGTFFVQLAAGAGAQVIAPALAEDEEYLRDLGATEILDRDADLDTALRERHAEGVDAILDVVNYAPQEQLLKAAGRIASPLGAAGEGPQRFNLMTQPAPEDLRHLAELLDNGTLRVHVQESYELERAGEALQALAENHTQGKLSITMV